MTAADILDALLKANLASGAAILGVVALRKLARSRFGARLAYGLWLLPVLAGAAVLLPARQVVVVRTSAPMVHAAFEIGRGLGPAPAVGAPTALDAPTLLVGLWLAGVAAAALVMAVLQHRFIARARQGGVGPAVVGLIAPRILIPADFAERYSPSEQALVLAHEQAHLASQDSRLNGLMAAIQCLNWFNPLVHLAAPLMRLDQELACDETVANRFPDARRAYAEVLMKAQLAVLPLPLGCYWPARTQHPLVERVAMLKRPRIGRTRWRTGAVALGCLWAGAGVAAWASQPAQVRTVFRTAPVVGEASEAEPPVAQAADPVPDAVVRPPAARPAPTPDQPQPAAFALAQASQPNLPVVIQRVLIEGAERIDQGTILSKLAMRPGDAVTAQTLDAALKTLFNTGLFANVNIDPLANGDLLVRVTEYPLIDQVKFKGNKNLKDEQLREVVQERPGEVFRWSTGGADADRILDLYRGTGRGAASAKVTIVELPNKRIDLVFMIDEGAKTGPPPSPIILWRPREVGGDQSGPVSIVADRANRDDDHHRVEFAGNVELRQDGRRVVSDLLNVQSYAPEEPGGPGIKEARWEGHVLVDTGDDAARADDAIFDAASKTITLSGHVVVERGQGMVKNDRLVIDAKR